MTKLLAATAAIALTAGAASAATVFSDTFDADVQGTNATPAGFAVTSGSVDVIGTGFFDFYPGNGNYVDLNGSTFQAGTIEQDISGLTVGTAYTLTFDYAFNTNSGNDEVLSFGIDGVTTVVPLTGAPPAFQTYTYNFTYTGADDTLFFADAGTTPGDNGGPVIDNILIATAAVPLPASGLLLLGALGAAGLARRRRKA